MISDEIFLLQTTYDARYYRSRRELAKAVLGGYANANFGRDKAPIIVRYQRGPTNVQNDDIAPELREFKDDLPDFMMANTRTRKECTDAMEAKIDELLQ